MSEPVKPRRRYSSVRRQEQAAQTRRDIVVAADALFRELGYAGTTMPVIARAAGVVVETVYRAFGSKAGLFGAVVDAAVAGGAARAARPVEERPAIRRVIEEPDPRRQLALYAATQPGIHERSGALLRALAAAAASDPELRTLWDGIERRRLEGQARLAAWLGEQGVLRADIGVEAARDVIWTLCSLAVHDMLVMTLGWAPSRYEAWLAGALVRELLADAS
jgi:AcrR family transcriptional regulator